MFYPSEMRISLMRAGAREGSNGNAAGDFPNLRLSLQL